jgi:DNA invertase Pin-like site-specific DNA recombinase
MKRVDRPTDENQPIRIGYVRVSRDDGKSMSVENQIAALLEYDPTMKIVVDKGVSGRTNISDPNSNWNRELVPFLEANPTAEIVVYTFDRVGRKKGKVSNFTEDHLEGGGTIYVLRDKKLYDDAENFEQALSLAFGTFKDENYRVEVALKTQRALDVQMASGVKLGAPPHLYEKHLRDIRDLHKRGLGYTAIGKVVRTQRVMDGKWQNTSPRTVKKVLSGEFVSREEWVRKNTIARLSMIGGGE